MDALEALWEQTRHHGETSKAAAIEAYAAKLAEYHPQAVLRVLDAWPSQSEWWPAWSSLEERLPGKDWRPGAVALPSPNRAETFHERVARLQLGSRLSAIGVAQWRHLIGRHHRTSDAELVEAIRALEARPARYDR